MPHRCPPGCKAWLMALSVFAAVWPRLGWAEPGVPGDSPFPLSTYSTRHYIVHTDLPRERAVPMGLHLDAVHEAYRKRFEGFPSRSGQTPEVFLLGEESRYQALLRRHGLSPDNTSGLFVVQPRIQGVVVWSSGLKPSRVQRVLQHEGFHQFANERLGHALPIWLNEGLAEYFEDGLLVEGRLRLGSVSVQRLSLLREAAAQGRVTPIERLLAMSPIHWAAVVRQDPRAAAVLYDHCWSLVHFLAHADGGRRRPALDELILRCSRGESAEAATQATLGALGLGAMQKDWERWLAAAVPSPLSEAMLRMQFLAEGLRVLHEGGRPAPTDAQELQRALRAIQLRAKIEHNGVAIAFDAAEEALFRYTHPDRGASPFVLLEATRPDQPPRLLAPSLDPEPVIAWSRDAKGQLQHDFTFRATPQAEHLATAASPR